MRAGRDHGQKVRREVSLPTSAQMGFRRPFSCASATQDAVDGEGGEGKRGMQPKAVVERNSRFCMGPRGSTGPRSFADLHADAHRLARGGDHLAAGKLGLET